MHCALCLCALSPQVLPPPEAAAFLAPLPVRVLPGVGRLVSDQLHAAGVATVAQLRALSPGELRERVGPRVAAVIAEVSLGCIESVEQGGLDSKHQPHLRHASNMNHQPLQQLAASK